MKIALVHDYLREWGGAEEVLQALHEIWPSAPIFTSYVRDDLFAVENVKEGEGASQAKKKDLLLLSKVSLQTSWLNNLPDAVKSSKLLTPLLPYAFGSFNLSDYDVVISSAASFAKTVQVKKPATHICYCHTPPRFLYNLNRERKESSLFDIVEKPIDIWLKAIDQAAAAKVDYFITNSNVVKNRIKNMYKKDATVIYPPVDTDKFVSDVIPDLDPESRGVLKQVQDDNKGEYFLTIGRLSPIKHFELAVEACTKLNIPLKVIGDGSEKQNLVDIAGPNVTFLGRLPNERIAHYVAGCKALINPVFDEDFGMVPIEVLGAGKPVISYASEAAKEILEDGITGKFFLEPTIESLQRILADFDESSYDANTLRSHAKKFSKEKFFSAMKDFVDTSYAGTSRS